MNDWRRAIQDALTRDGGAATADEGEVALGWSFYVADDLTVTCEVVGGLNYSCFFSTDELEKYGPQWEERVLSRLSEAHHAVQRDADDVGSMGD